MKVIVLAPDEAMGKKWQYAVEDLGEAWWCTPVTEAEAVLPLLPGTELLLLPGGETSAVLARVLQHIPVAPPFILGEGAPDGLLPPVEELPALLSKWRREGNIPALAQRNLPAATEMAAALLRRMDAPRRLRAWTFLPEMCALTVTHPPLLRDLQHGLYPMMAARHGMTAAGVERSLRLWVESTWMHGSLDALDRFFGASVDPEKGKPTNREFLCGVQAQLTRAMQRLQQRE